MKNECSIIRDLLPLYAEDMVSAETAAFVEEHIKTCEACRREYEQTKEPQRTREAADTAPLQKLRKKLRIKRIQTIALTAVFVITLLVSAFAVLDAPVYLPYSEGLITAEVLGDKGLLLTFREDVTDFDCTVYEDLDSGAYFCDVEAWTSLWDKWVSPGEGKLTATVTARETKPLVLFYVPNDGSENICLAKYDPNAGNKLEEDADYGHAIALPRLALGYYLILAAAALVIMGILWGLTRKRAAVRVWVERIGLYPAAYIISHCIVSGIHWATYSMPRDFALIVFLSVLLYSGLLLGHSLWRLKREIRESER